MIPFKDLKPETQVQIRKLLEARKTRKESIGGALSVGAITGMLPLILYSAKTNPSAYADWYARLISKSALPIAAGTATAVTIMMKEAEKANEQVKSNTIQAIQKLKIEVRSPEHQKALQQNTHAFINRNGDVILTREKEAKTIIGRAFKKLKRMRTPL